MREFVRIDREDLPETYDAEAFGGQPLVEVRESDQQIEVSYRFPGFFRSGLERDVRGAPVAFDVLEIAGLGRLMASGKPELPTFGRYVQIPPGSEFHVAVETPVPPVEISTAAVLPAQAQMNDGVGPHAFEYDPEFYARDEFYPKDLVTTAGPFVIDGYTAVLLHVCPLQFNAKRKLLRAWSRVVVTLALRPQPGARTRAPQGPDSREAHGNLFLNPRRNVAPRAGVDIGPLPPLQVAGSQMLIACAPRFEDPARVLARWKERVGLTTELLPFDIGGVRNPRGGSRRAQGGDPLAAAHATIRACATSCCSATRATSRTRRAPSATIPTTTTRPRTTTRQPRRCRCRGLRSGASRFLTLRPRTPSWSR